MEKNTFTVKKTGENADEVRSYGLANSYYQPYIFMDDDLKTINFGKWMDGQVLRNYITVQEGERFSYDSVISNMKKDMHPSLYFMVLHTICSFFRTAIRGGTGFASILYVLYYHSRLIMAKDKNEERKMTFWEWKT